MSFKFPESNSSIISFVVRGCDMYSDLWLFDWWCGGLLRKSLNGFVSEKAEMLVQAISLSDTLLRYIYSIYLYIQYTVCMYIYSIYKADCLTAVVSSYW